MNVLENYLIQLSQNSSMIVYEQTLRSTAKSQMHLETPHTLHSLSSTDATEQSETFPLLTHTSIENTDRLNGDICFTFQIRHEMVYTY